MGDFESVPVFGEEVKVDPDTNILQINKKHFRLEYSEHGKPYLIEVDPKKYDKMVNKIMSGVIESLDREKLLKYCLNKMPIEDLQKIEKKLDKPRKPKMSTDDGCVEMRVGGVAIPLVD